MSEPAGATEPHVVLDQRGGNVALDLFVLNQHLGALLDVAFAGTGVTPSQYAVYSQLGDRISTPGRIGQTLGLRPGTLSGYLAAMESRGHLTRTRSERDGRSHQIALSADGLTTWRDCRDRMRTAVRALNARLGSTAERDELRHKLGALDDAIVGTTDSLRSRPTIID